MRSLLLILFSATAVLGQGTILWDEGVNGPFSESSGTPTSLSPLQFGTNSIIGSTAIEPSGGNWIVHPDYFDLQVPNGSIVTAVYLQINKPNVWHWVGDTTFANEVGFIQNPASGELLSQWGLSQIPTGNYGMYLANLDEQATTSIANYRLDFFVQTIPEPSTFALALAGATMLVVWRRKKRP